MAVRWDEETERRMTQLEAEVRRRVAYALTSPRRARIGLEIIVEDRRVSVHSEVILRLQPLRGLTAVQEQEQT